MKRGPEADLQRALVELAESYGWRVYHPPDNVPRADKSGRMYVQSIVPGWPDLTLVRVPELVIAELKSERGRLSDAQQAWLDDLAACGIETYIWRPRDFDAAHARLRRRPVRPQPRSRR